MNIIQLARRKIAAAANFAEFSVFIEEKVIINVAGKKGQDKNNDNRQK